MLWLEMSWKSKQNEVMDDRLEQCWDTKTQKLSEPDLDNVLLQLAHPRVMAFYLQRRESHL